MRQSTPRSRIVAALGAVSLTAVLGACGETGEGDSGSTDVLRISAIPDQDPQKLLEREGAMAEYLAAELGMEVEYVPVTDYAASVSLFSSGDLDLVFFGGLTGVQARLQTPGAELLAQRDIDEAFQSVFIANADVDVPEVGDVVGLAELAGTRFTFGSESSTSGRLMPEYFLSEAGLDSSQDFDGPPGFSGSHDLTIDLVESGSYQVGALNSQVWEAREAAGTVDLDKVRVVFTTPAYADYHWLLGPEAAERLGEDGVAELQEALLGLDGSDAEEQAVLEPYGAEALVPAEVGAYDRIETVARQLGLVAGD